MKKIVVYLFATLFFAFVSLPTFGQVVITNSNFTCTQTAGVSGTLSPINYYGMSPSYMSQKISTTSYGGGSIYPYFILRVLTAGGVVQTQRPTKISIWVFVPVEENAEGFSMVVGVRNNIPGPDTNLNNSGQPTIIYPTSTGNFVLKEFFIGTTGGATWNECVIAVQTQDYSQVHVNGWYIASVFATMPGGGTITLITGNGTLVAPNPPTTGFYPGSGAPNVPIPVCFTWTLQTGTVDRLQISTMSNFSIIIYDQEITTLPICIGSPTLQPNTTYYWRVQRRFTGQSTFGGWYYPGWFHTASSTGITPITGEIPKMFKLEQNYPNPFNPVTNIKFAIPKSGLVNLKVYDIAGKEVRNLVNEVKSAGYYIVDFNASDLTSGTYFYRLQAGDFVEVKKMMLIK